MINKLAKHHNLMCVFAISSQFRPVALSFDIVVCIAFLQEDIDPTRRWIGLDPTGRWGGGGQFSVTAIPTCNQFPLCFELPDAATSSLCCTAWPIMPWLHTWTPQAQEDHWTNSDMFLDLHSPNPQVHMDLENISTLVLHTRVQTAPPGTIPTSLVCQIAPLVAGLCLVIPSTTLTCLTHRGQSITGCPAVP
jgi:hypothetical protein